MKGEERELGRKIDVSGSRITRLPRAISAGNVVLAKEEYTIDCAATGCPPERSFPWNVPHVDIALR